MGVVTMRRRPSVAVVEEAPLPRKLLMGLLFMALVFGYLIISETELPSQFLLFGAGLAFLLLFMVGMRRTDIPLYVLVAYLPFSKMLAGDFSGFMTAFNLTNLLLVLVVMSWAANPGREGRLKLEPHALHAPIFLMVLWAIISFGYHEGRLGIEYLGSMSGVFKRWLDPILLYFLFFSLVKDRQRWKTIVVLIMIGVTIAALMAVVDYMGMKESTSLEKSRIGGIAGQPNILGAFFVYYMFLFAGFWLQRIRQWRAWGYLIPFLLCFRGIMVTFSRGAYLAFAQGVMGLAFFKSKLLFALAVLAVGVAALNPWLLPPGIRYRLESTFRNRSGSIADVYTDMPDLQEELARSATVRLIVWRGGLDMIKEDPAFGVGLGRFPINIKHFTHEYGLYKYVDAHNTYLITAAEMGVPALVFLIFTFLAIFRITAVVYRHHPDPFIQATALGFLGGLSGLLMANMFGSRMNTTEVSGYFWILAALMARAHRWVREAQGTRRRGRGVVRSVPYVTGVER